MFKHHLFGLLKTFTKASIANFKTFLSSSYFNNSTKIVALYDEIIRYYPSFDSPKLTKENLCKKISRRGIYNDSTIRDAMSTLLRLAQQFIVQKMAEENKFDSMNYLLKELSKKKQEYLFRKNSSKLDEEIMKEGNIDSSHLFSKFLFETNKFNYGVINNEIINKKNIFKQFEKLNKSGVYLTYFFLTELICEYLNLLSYSRKYNLNYKENSIYRCLNELDISKIAHVFEEDNEYTFLMNIYIKLFEAYSDLDKERNYIKYKEMVLEFSDKLSRDERSFHYSRLINYCIMKKVLGKNKRKFDLELFGIYELILEKEYFSDSKVEYLPIDLFRDILLQALSLKKFKWAEYFIKTYNKKVNPGESLNMLNLGYAYLTYEKKEYSRTLDYLNKISIKNFIYKYDMRNLLLKVYYELGYTEEILYEIHSYLEFLRKNTMVSENRRIRFGNFAKFLEKLVLVKEQKSHFKIEYVKHQLIQAENVSFKEWLLDHYCSLENSLSKGNKT